MSRLGHSASLVCPRGRKVLGLGIVCLLLQQFYWQNMLPRAVIATALACLVVGMASMESQSGAVVTVLRSTDTINGSRIE